MLLQSPPMALVSDCTRPLQKLFMSELLQPFSVQGYMWGSGKKTWPTGRTYDGEWRKAREEASPATSCRRTSGALRTRCGATARCPGRRERRRQFLLGFFQARCGPARSTSAA